MLRQLRIFSIIFLKRSQPKSLPASQPISEGLPPGRLDVLNAKSHNEVNTMTMAAEPEVPERRKAD